MFVAEQPAGTRRFSRARNVYAVLSLVAALGVAAVTQAPSAHAVDFAPGQNASRLLGAPDWTTGAHVSTSNMRYGIETPAGVAVDSGGSVFVSEGSNRIMRWAATPAFNGADATNAVQTKNDSLDDFWASCSSGTSQPEQLSVVGDGAAQKLLIADRYNHRVAVFQTEPTASSDKATLYLGQAGSGGCQSNRGFPYIPSASTLSQPTGVWSDGTKIAVADKGNHRVLLWDSWPASGDTGADHVLGQTDFTSLDPNRGGAAAANTLDDPSGVTFDGTRLYVADSDNNRVLVWNAWPSSNGQAADRVVGQPDMTSTGSACSSMVTGHPTSVSTFGSGAGHRLAVAVKYQSRILVWNNHPGSSGDGVAASTALGQASTSSCGSNAGSAVPRADTIRQASVVQFDPSGNLWVADDDNNRVLRFPSLATGSGADRVLGHVGVDAVAMAANTPYDLQDNAYLGQSSSTSGAYSIGGSVTMVPGGGLVLTSGKADVTMVWNSDPVVDNEPFTWRLGQEARSLSGDNGASGYATAIRQCDPIGTWSDGTRLLVADECNNRVLVWTSMPTGDTDPPDFVIGQTDFTSKGSATSATGLHSPSDVTSDGTDVYVSDNDNNRVLVYRGYLSAPSDGPAASFVIGQSGFGASSSGISSTTLNGPKGIDIDDRGRLAIADFNNNRIVIYADADAIASNGAPMDAVAGQVDMTSKSSGTKTYTPQDVTVAGNALLWAGATEAYTLDPLPISGATDAASAKEIGTGGLYAASAQDRLGKTTGIDALGGTAWVVNTGHGRAMRWVDATGPTLTAGPTATVRCDGTVTVSWTTSESTSTEIKWDSVSRGAWGDPYANSSIDPVMNGLVHTYDLSFPTAGTYYAIVRGVDWTGTNPEFVSSEISFTVPPTCPAPTTMFGDDVNAQAGTGRTNPSATNTPPILTSAFHQSWLNVSGVTMDRVQTQTWTTPPEHAGGLWHLDSSGAADPNSQYTAAATWTGAPNYAAGRFGQAVTTSPGNYLRIPNDSAISRSNDFTVDAWFRTTDLSQSPYAKLVIKSTNTGCGAGTDCNFGIYLGRDTGNICGASISTSGTKYSVCRSHSGLIDGSWHHAAITVSSTNVLQLYLDGLPAGAAQAMNNQARTTTNDMTVGNTLDNGNPFVGDIDEVRFSPVAYDAAAIAGYFRTSRPHAQQLWTLASTALGANCTTATRCEDQAYAGVAEILRPGARYWQRTRLNTLNNDYWTDYGIDWLETESTSTITITAGATVAFGSQLPGIDAFGTTDIDVTSNSPAGYQLLARDEDDAWALQRTPATDSIADLQNGADPPAAWVSGAAGYFGVGVLDATGNRLPKWGSLGGPWPTTDTTNNLYTGLENSTDVLLHERTSYSLATDTITMISRVNAGPTDLAGDYDGLITLTAVANP